MLKEAKTLFFCALRNKEHRRRQQAAAVFTVMWMLSVLFTIMTNFLLISVQALLLLNTAVSLVACVIAQVLCSRGGTQQNYPFTFGFYRLSTVVRLGSIVFLIFGCLTTLVESLHRGMHVHHSNPYYLLSISALQLVFQIAYRREVRVVDRVTGHHGMAGAQSEVILHQACATASSEGRGGAIGGGDFFKTMVDVEASVASPTATLGSCGSGGAASRTVHNKAITVILYLLCPLTSIAVSIVLMITHNAVFDTAGALLLAGYYGCTGYQEGKAMLDLLMNKCVTDVRRNRNLERCLRSVKMLDGVLQVQSTVWWNVNVSDSMLLVRIRLMSGSDACAVSQAVRRQLMDLATHVYVECFPANGTDGSISENSLLLLGTPVLARHSHSHSHSYAHSHRHEHYEHSHDHNHHHGYDGEDEEKEFGAVGHSFSNEAIMDGNPSQNTFRPNSHSPGAPVSPYRTGNYAAGGFSERTAPLSFPAPPSSSLPLAGPEGGGNGARHSRLGTKADLLPQPLVAPPLYGKQDVGPNTTNNSNNPGGGNDDVFPAAPLSTFPQFPYNPRDGLSSHNCVAGNGGSNRHTVSPAGEKQYDQPVLHTMASCSESFPLRSTFSSSTRSGVAPPPVFTPFHPAEGEDRRGSFSTQDCV